MSTFATHIPDAGELTATLHTRGAGAPIAGGNDGDFDSLMAGVDGGVKDHDEVREAAEGLVGIAFVLPMLKMMRDQTFKTDLFHGGQGEKMFAARLDEKLADRMTRRMGMDLVDSVYDRFAGMAGGGKQAAAQVSGTAQEVDHRG